MLLLLTIIYLFFIFRISTYRYIIIYTTFGFTHDNMLINNHGPVLRNFPMTMNIKMKLIVLTFLEVNSVTIKTLAKRTCKYIVHILVNVV